MMAPFFVAFLCALPPIVVHVQTLAQLYPELRLTRDDLMEQLQVYTLDTDTSVMMNDTQTGMYLPVHSAYTQELTYAIVDKDDYEHVKDYSWRVLSSGFVVAPIEKKVVYLHRLIMGDVSKHVNGNKLDNRRINLKLALPRGKQKKPLSSSTSLDQSTS